MATKKQNKGGAGKFFLGAAIGAFAAAIASKFVKEKCDEEEFEDLLKDLSVLRDELTKQYA